MGINLQKGQRISLTKDNQGLSKIMVGLGWDPVKSGGGFLSGLFGGGGPNIDCDASAIMLGASGKLMDKHDVIYFGNLSSNNRSIQHMGDNLTGDGDGDDEQIMVNLPQVPADIEKIIFVVNIYECVSRRQDFGMIQNAFIRIVNGSNNQELLRYNLTEQYSGKTALTIGELYRHNSEWKFAAIGEGTNDTSLGQMVQRYT